MGSDTATKDFLVEMFSMQRAAKIRYKDTYDQDYINIMTLAAQAELSEFLQETPWKYWKNYKPEDFTHDRAHGELIDVFHFLINLCLAVGMSAEDVYDRFKSKNLINAIRVKEGY